MGAAARQFDPRTEMVREGVAIVPGMFDAVRCAELVQAGAEAMRPFTGARSIVMVHRIVPEALGFMRDQALVALVEWVVGGEASGLGSELFRMPPGTKGMNAHQDNYYLGAQPDFAVSVWVPLVDVHWRNGGLYYVPGSQHAGLLEHDGVGDVDQSLRARHSLAGWRDVRMSAGEALFIDPLVVHGSHDNGGEADRWALVMTYIRRGTPYRAGGKQRREEVALR